MGIRTGDEYVAGLRNTPRDLWLGGKRIDDVTEHPAFTQPIARIAELYQAQHGPDHAVLTRPGDTGPVGASFVLPRSHADLVARREAYRVWAEQTLGLMGRSPDLTSTILASFAHHTEVFEELGQGYADNVRSYYEHVRDHDLFLTHALVPPQTDRSAGRERRDVEVVGRTTDGLVVRGARMLATFAPIADELLIYCLPTLTAADTANALVFAIPIDTPGLRLICRPPFDDGSADPFDHPLAARFEEPDALVVFDDVLVPWHRVFLHEDVDLVNSVVRRTLLREHSGQQQAVRSWVKMRLVTGVALRLCRTIGVDTHLHVREKLGRALVATEMCRGLLVASEHEHTTANGFAIPKLQTLEIARLHMSSTYPVLVELLQTFGGGGLLMMPSKDDFGSAIAPDVERYYRGADDRSALDRVRLFKLAWDLVGDGFGQRAVQFERYYAGDPVRRYANASTEFDSADCVTLADRALAQAEGVADDR